MKHSLIKINGITKTFGSLEVLRGVSLSIPEGQITAIVGPSGAGKTTLLQIIGTLDKPDGGHVSIGGEDPFALNRSERARFRNQNIGFVFQFHQLLPEFTAVENVAIPAMIGGMKKRIALAKASELLERLGLSDRVSHKPGELSGGEKQRVAVARALINNPQVVLADEPSGSLDSERKEELHTLFFDLCAQSGQTFVIVTHDESLARRAHHCITLADGRVVGSNSPELLL